MTALALTPPPARYGIDDHPLSGIKPEEWMTRSAKLTAEGLSRLAIDLDALMEINRQKERERDRTSSR
jgi:hypothetical protein